ncbi:ethanolamine ammonia-lyase reactivating factor EutA [Candidatus Saccharibacteria bacterium]|nr:ethanolamine ammonia-lyase reactivating factor EutA [Candidatus Saccharibacteria bacterium]
MLTQLNDIKAKTLAKLKKRASRHGERYIVALDIGTENVKALIGRIVEDEIEIVGVGRAHQGLQDMQAGAISDIASVTANCNKALAEAEKLAGVSARAVVIGIAGELVKGTTITVKVQRKDAKKALDIEEVERIVELVQKRAYDRAKQQIADELGGKDIDVQLVNSALVRMEIDGYEVTNPVGFQGKQVVVQLYTAFAPLIHIGALEQVANQLDMDLLAVAAEPFAVARSVIGDADDSTMSAILMDVGGGTTDIAVLNEGGVQGTQMFGIGGRAFTRSIAREIEVGFVEAEKLKLGLVDGTAPSQMVEKIEKALSKTVRVWRGGIELALGEYDNLEHLPHNILLCGGGSSLEMLTAELESADWYRKLPFARKPRIQFISPEAVIGITDVTDTLKDHTFVTAMGLLRVGLDTIAQNDEVADEANVQGRINRILRI